MVYACDNVVINMDSDEHLIHLAKKLSVMREVAIYFANMVVWSPVKAETRVNEEFQRLLDLKTLAPPRTRVCADPESDL